VCGSIKPGQTFFACSVYGAGSGLVKLADGGDFAAVYRHIGVKPWCAVAVDYPAVPDDQIVCHVAAFALFSLVSTQR
jgi:hypothetical protein